MNKNICSRRVNPLNIKDYLEYLIDHTLLPLQKRCDVDRVVYLRDN